jgi:hypothetical protein
MGLAGGQSMAVHSYEEIRRVAIDLLSGRETSPHLDQNTQQFQTFRTAVAGILRTRDGLPELPRHKYPWLEKEDSETFRQVFWDLFRQSIITPGLGGDSIEFPFFSVSRAGEHILNQESTYFFHDVTSYEKVIRENIPNIDPATLLYLMEAMQAFKAGCMLASTVMVGVAAEHTFSLLLEAAENSPAYGMHFKKAAKEQKILAQFKEFDKALESHVLPHRVLDKKIVEGLEIEFAGILQIIRTFRNSAGHPTGTILSREQTYVLLQVFIPFCKKAYALMGFFKGS